MPAVFLLFNSQNQFKASFAYLCKFTRSMHFCNISKKDYVLWNFLVTYEICNYINQIKYQPSNTTSSMACVLNTQHNILLSAHSNTKGHNDLEVKEGSVNRKKRVALEKRI